MKIILAIIGMIILVSQLSFAEEEAELIWRTDRLGGNGSISDVEISNTREIFYNVLDNIVQVRNIIDGLVIDTITFNNHFEYINGISITNDDRYLAVSGNGSHIIIWDLENNQEYKRLTKTINEEQSAQFWKSISISPDGSKVSAIAVRESFNTVTELVVFDLETGEVLISKNRKSLDKINEVYYGPEWGSTEFSPNGEYLVTELGVNWDHQSGQVVLDSVYVYNTNNYTIEGQLQNQFENRDISFSSYENVMSSTYGSTLTIYNLDTKESNSKTFNSYMNSVVFSRQSKKLIHKIGLGKPYIFDYNLMDTIFSYSAYCLGNKVTLDNNYIICNANGALSLVYANWDGITSVSQTGNEDNVLYPNPSDSKLNVKLDIKNTGIFQYQIFDMNSNLVLTNKIGFLQRGDNAINIDISSLISQSYILKISSKFESYDFKFIKE